MAFVYSSAASFIFIYGCLTRTMAASVDGQAVAATDDSQLCLEWCDQLSLSGNAHHRISACKNYFEHVCKEDDTKAKKTSEADAHFSEHENSYLEETLIEKIKGLLKEHKSSPELQETSDNTNKKMNILKLAKDLYSACINGKTTAVENNVSSAVVQMLETFNLGEWPLVTAKEGMTVEHILNGAGLRPVATVTSAGIQEQKKYVLSLTIPRAPFAPSEHVWKHPEAHAETLRKYRRVIRASVKLLRPSLARNAYQNDDSYTDEYSDDDMNTNQEKKDYMYEIVSDIIAVESEINKMIPDALVYEEEIHSIAEWEQRIGNKFPLFTSLTRDFKTTKSTISTEDKIIIHLKKYFEDLAAHLHSLKPRRFYNYCGWFYIRNMADVLTYNIREKLHSYLEQAGKPRIPIKLDESNCAKKLRGLNGLMDKGISYIYLGKYLQMPSVEKAKKLAQYVNTTFYQFIEQNKWMDTDTRGTVSKWAGDLHYHVGASGEIFDEASVSEAYKYVTLSGTPSLALYFFRARENNFLQKLELHMKPYDKNGIWPLSALETQPSYEAHYVSLEAPAGLLQDPIFKAGGPASHNFGSAGSLIAETLAFGSTDEGRVWQPEFREKGDYKWSEGSKKALLERANECMKDKKQKDQRRRNKGSLEGRASRLPLELKVQDHIGLRLSYTAFKDFTKKCACPGDEVSARQAFFKSYTKMQCIQDSEDVETRTNYALATYREFFEAFDCSESDRMRLEDTCKIMPPSFNDDAASQNGS